MAPKVTTDLLPTEDTKAMWDNIHEMYGKLDRVKIFSLTQALSELKQENLSITSFFSRLSTLWNELKAAEEQLEGPKATRISGPKFLLWIRFRCSTESSNLPSKKRTNA